VLIACTPRSGSWLLAEALRGSGVAGRPEEYFRLDLEPGYRESLGVRSSAPYSDLVQRVVQVGSTPNDVFAIKVHWFQLVRALSRLRAELPQATAHRMGDLALLERHLGPVSVVHLQRADLLRQAVSWHRAICSDEWWLLRGSPSSRHPPYYDFEAITHLHFLLRDYNESWCGWLRDNGIDAISVRYEELAGDYPRTMRRVLAALDLSVGPRLPPPALARQANAQTEELVRLYRASWAAVFPGAPLPAVR
jgi:LPS sulfotransferase NodH